ncbi:Erythronate-4-phosphate dehydrogenase [Trema orientale]|uniref:glyoxylate reductase (NADP(+)) n=1 Tax=Trema orientale TaxID=63057 RepID=A0A2P5EHY1_TREOI|nr:Erythronate-4-phosphate dehydrogenase [Trema orientale]
MSHKELPLVLVLGSPLVLTMFEDRFTQRFRILKASDSDLPLDQFLASSSHARSATALLCAGFRVSGETIGQLPSLGLVVTASAGVNHIDVSECRRRGIVIADSGESLSEDVADMAVGLLIDVCRKISAADRYLRKGNWAAFGDFPLAASKLGGKRVGIVGLGRIGSEVAKRLEVFGCKISYNSRKKKDSVTYPFYIHVHELAANNDAIVVCCGLSDQTRHMIDKKVLLALGKEGVIVNVARGEVINEKEMIQCLLQGEIGGAGLDVFEDEPNVPKELFGLDNVVLSPHNAVLTPDSFESLCEVTIRNLEAFFSKKPLLSELVRVEI